MEVVEVVQFYLKICVFSQNDTKTWFSRKAMRLSLYLVI